LDLGFPVSSAHLAKNIERYYSLWDIIPPGIAISRNLPLLPYQIFILLFSKFVPLIIIEKLLFYLWFAGAGLSMYYLTTILVGKRLASLISGIFYMLNPYSMVFIWGKLTLSVFFYALFPLMAALYIKGLKEEKRWFYYILLFSLSSLGAIPAFSNPVYALLLWIFIFSYLSLHLLINRRERYKINHALRFTTFTLIIWILFHTWWILPLASSLQQEFKQASLEDIGKSNLDVLELNSQDATLCNILRLGGYWGFNRDYRGDLYYPYSPIYSSSIFILIGFLIPFLTFLPFIPKQRNGTILCIGGICLLSLFLTKGLNPPFGGVFGWIFSHFPILGAFRNQCEKFGLILTLSYAPLIGLAMNRLYAFGRRLQGKVIALILVIFPSFLIFGVYAWPFWAGEVIYSGGKIIPSFQIKPPEYYYQADEWLGSQREDFRIFPLPFPKLGYTCLDWRNGYMGINPSLWLLSKPIIARNVGMNSSFPLLIAEHFTKNQLGNNMGKLLALLNVKYILLHRDTNWDYIEDHPWWVSTSKDNYRFILNHQHGIHLKKSFGKLDFYENGWWRPLHLYATSEISLVRGGVEEGIRYVLSKEFQVNKTILFLDNQLNLSEWQFLKDYQETYKGIDYIPKLQFERFNPTRYKVYIKTQRPIFLVFSESFHPGWKAYMRHKIEKRGQESDKGQLSVGWSAVLSALRDWGKRVELKEHYLVNGYANAWYVPVKSSSVHGLQPQSPGKGNNNEEIEIVIEYIPQRVFEIGLFISGLTLIGCIGFLGWNWKKREIL
jgi:hypothetical protein